MMQLSTMMYSFKSGSLHLAKLGSRMHRISQQLVHYLHMEQRMIMSTSTSELVNLLQRNVCMDLQVL